MSQFPHLSLVTGGIASGKSDWAEALASTAKRPRVYIATAEARDDEMRTKIARHRQQRGDGWQTIEAPLDLPAALRSVAADRVVLIDCLTLWLSNHLLAGSDLSAQTEALRTALIRAEMPVILVSNEVGSGGIGPHAEMRRFQQAQGVLNRQIAASADLAVAVIAGLPLALKGVIPQGVQ